MEDIVQSALDQADAEHKTTDAARQFGDPEIVALGCGATGVAGVEHIAGRTTAVDLMAIAPEDDTAQFHSETSFRLTVDSSTIDETLVFDTPPTAAALKTTSHVRRLADALERTDLCFIVGNLTTTDGFVATSVAAAAVEQSSAMGIGLLTVTTGSNESQSNRDPMRRLLSTVDMTILFDKDRVQTSPKDSERRQALVASPEEFAARFVINAATTVVEPSLINLDYADLTSIWQRGDIGTLATGADTFQSHTEVPEFARQTIDRPLYPIDYTQIGGCWIQIVGGPDLTLKTAEKFAQSMTEHPVLSETAPIVWSARITDALEDEIVVETLLTGASSNDLPIVPEPE